MKKSDSVLSGYEFTYENDSYYLFSTEYKIRYLIEFRPTFYLFDPASLYAKSTYEFIIKVVDSPISRPPLDRRTSKTISNIFEDFYERFSETITIYVCESADNRQISRSRKFHIWFEEFNGERYIKYDTSLTDSSGIVYPISILFRRNNPHKHQIFKEFDEVLEGYRTGK